MTNPHTPSPIAQATRLAGQVREHIAALAYDADNDLDLTALLKKADALTVDLLNLRKQIDGA